MDGRERGLAWDENELAPFLNHHIGGTLDQVVAGAVSDGGQRAHGAGTYHHRIRRPGTGSDGCQPVFPCEHMQLLRTAAVAFQQHDTGFRCSCRQGKIQLLFGNELCSLRIHQVNGMPAIQQHFQQARGVTHAGSPGHGKCDGFIHFDLISGTRGHYGVVRQVPYNTAFAENSRNHATRFFGSGNTTRSTMPCNSSTFSAPSSMRRATTSFTNTSGADAPAVTPMRVLPASQAGASFS